MAMRLVGDKKGNDKGGKGNGDRNECGGQQRGHGWQGNGNGMGGVSIGDGNKEVNGNGNKGGGGAMAAAIKRAVMMATRVVGNSNGNAGKRDGNGKEGDW